VVTKQEYYSKIAALVNISQSDVSYIYPEYTTELEQSDPELLKNLLWNLGLDVNQPYVFQQVRNTGRSKPRRLCAQITSLFSIASYSSATG